MLASTALVRKPQGVRKMGGDLAEEMYNEVEKGAGELQGFRKALLDQP